MRTWGSSKGIFLETCIMPRMITRLVLEQREMVSNVIEWSEGYDWRSGGCDVHLRIEAHHD